MKFKLTPRIYFKQVFHNDHIIILVMNSKLSVNPNTHIICLQNYIKSHTHLDSETAYININYNIYY